MIKIVRYPNDILATVCEPIEPGSARAREVAKNLREASSSGRRMVGLSAPQIGDAVRIFVMDKHYLGIAQAVYVNPEIVAIGGEVDRMGEQCMSLPSGVEIQVSRATSITVRAHTETGHLFVIELRGLAARCAQHEIDHLNGITILDRASKKEKRNAIQKITLDIKNRRR